MFFSQEYKQQLIAELKGLFSHLHVHSEFSNIRLLDSTNKIPKMIRYVESLGQNALALTDHESLSGHIQFLQAVKEMKDKKEIPQDFKPILGNEIYLTNEQEMRKEIKEKNGTTFYHFLLLAKDKKGHHQLKQLSTTAWGRMFSYKGMDRVPTFYNDFENIIGNNKGHLIACSACLGGYIAQNVLKILQEENEEEIIKYKMKIHDFITWCVNMFGKEDFYIEIQPAQTVEQIEFNKMALNIAKGYGLKHIITTDAHYLTIKDRPIHKAYLTSDGDGENNREVDAFYNSTYFFTIEELFNHLSYLDIEDIKNGVLNTKEIADKIEVYDLYHKQIVPKTNIPNEKTWYYNKELYSIGKEYEYIDQMINSNIIYDRFLISEVFKGISKKIDKENYKDTFERINIECKEIIGISKAKDESMSSYLTTMQKIIDIIWSEAESITAPSRGSAAGFIINYLIGITQINPLKQNIEMPHWRFISAERPDMMDIDTDFPSYKRNKVFECLLKYYNSIGGDVVRVCTFGTETAKSAIQTACRGVKINNDIGLYLSSLIPVERGKVWSLYDCYYGNEKKGREPITEFKNIINGHKDKHLLEVALGVEGLINKRSSHACGVIPLNDEFTKYNAKMRTPSGELITQYDLHDSEYMGGVKYDFLNTKTCGMIQKCLEMLVECGKIEWQGSLRKTYNKYLHPDVIDRDNPQIWKKLNDGELISAFQFDSLQGEQALRSIKPKNLLEASSANTLMRLMVEDGKEQPMEMYVRYKQDISEWYKDMEDFGLNQEEIELMEEHLLKDYGVCATQERMMLMSMDDNIAGFNVVEGNKLRKGVAKKVGKQIEEAHQLLYNKGKEIGASKTLLDYVWDEQLSMQKGYSFSILHTIGYTWILVQQLNLIHYYPSIYWNTAVLLVESGAVELEGENENKKEKNTNYGIVAKAIGNMQDKEVSITLPDINKAKIGFAPREEDNEIMFGLKGIMTVNNETAKLIIENRPFTSLRDFYKKMVLVKRKVTLSNGKIQNRSLVSEGQVVTLIKAGCFDKVENKPRKKILENYLKVTNPSKKKLSTKDIINIIEMGVIPNELKDEVRFFKFREYIKTLTKKKDEETKTIKWHCLKGDTDFVTEHTNKFFMDSFAFEMEEDKDYKYDEEGNMWIALGTVRKGSFEDIYKTKVEKLMSWLNKKECLNKYNEILFNEVKNDKMLGSVSTWEMQSMNFYYHEHELAHINREKYDIINYNDLPKEPKTIGFNIYKGMKYPKFDLKRIAGTVLDRDKNRHVIALLTPDGVVNVKFYSGQFAFYDRQISRENEDGTKTTLEDGWFKRGNKLLITGFKRGDQFKPKIYKNSVYQHSVYKIVNVKEDGNLDFQTERVSADDN